MGAHDVRAQWRAETGGVAGLGDRTLTLSAGTASTSAPARKYFLAANDLITAPAAPADLRRGAVKSLGTSVSEGPDFAFIMRIWPSISAPKEDGWAFVSES